MLRRPSPPPRSIEGPPRHPLGVRRRQRAEGTDGPRHYGPARAAAQGSGERRDRLHARAGRFTLQALIDVEAKTARDRYGRAADTARRNTAGPYVRRLEAGGGALDLRIPRRCAPGPLFHARVRRSRSATTGPNLWMSARSPRSRLGLQWARPSQLTAPILKVTRIRLYRRSGRERG